MATTSPTDDELANTYDVAFIKQADKKTSKPGDAHRAALRAVYTLAEKNGKK